MISEPLLSISSLSRVFGERRVVSDVSFEVGAGEFLSLLGPNGSGKSTLLRCIMRVLEADSGRVKLQGRDTQQLSRKELAQSVGYVPQDIGFTVPYTVKEFVEVSLLMTLPRFYSVGASDRDDIQRVLQSCGLGALQDRLITELSGGERQRVLIASALVGKPILLLLDEPTAHLDAKHADEVLEVLAELRSSSSLSVLLVTHDLHIASVLSERALALREGRVAFLGEFDQLLKEDLLEEIYDIPFAKWCGESEGSKLLLPDWERRRGR